MFSNLPELCWMGVYFLKMPADFLALCLFFGWVVPWNAIFPMLVSVFILRIDVLQSFSWSLAWIGMAFNLWDFLDLNKLETLGEKTIYNIALDWLHQHHTDTSECWGLTTLNKRLSNVSDVMSDTWIPLCYPADDKPLKRYDLSTKCETYSL